MPNRILRDWTDSFKIDELDVNSERFFVRLIMKVDDYGRFYSDARLIKANLFPLKTDVRDTDISRWLTACEKAGLIVIYNIANKGYLQIIDFKQTLRQKKLKYPPPNEPCYASDTHTHSNSESNVIPETKRNETESEDEDEPKNSPPPENRYFDNSDLSISIDDCLKAYFENNEFARAREQICMSRYLQPDILRRWGEVFVRELIAKGTTKKTINDFAKHFLNWIKFRSNSETPENYEKSIFKQPEKQIENAQQQLTEWEKSAERSRKLVELSNRQNAT